MSSLPELRPRATSSSARSSRSGEVGRCDVDDAPHVQRTHECARVAGLPSERQRVIGQLQTAGELVGEEERMGEARCHPSRERVMSVAECGEGFLEELDLHRLACGACP